MSDGEWKTVRDLHDKVRALTGWASTADVDEVDAEFSAALARLRAESQQREADAAAMREALEFAERTWGGMLGEDYESPMKAALATDAGRALLERVRTLEDQSKVFVRDAIAPDGKWWSTRAEKAEAERDEAQVALEALRFEAKELRSSLDGCTAKVVALAAERDAEILAHAKAAELYAGAAQDVLALRAEVQRLRTRRADMVLDGNVAVLHPDELAEALAQARAEERERCIGAAKSWEPKRKEVSEYATYQSARDGICAAIRALGDS